VNWKYDIVKRVENKDWKCATLTTVWWWNHEKKVEDLIFVGGGIKNKTSDKALIHRGEALRLNQLEFP